MTAAKVLFVIGSLNTGGAELQMVMLAEELAHRGTCCEVFALDASGPLRRRLDGAGIAVHDGGYRSDAPVHRKILMLFGGLFRLFQVCRNSRPDVLQAYLPVTNLLGALAGRAAGIPRIITCRRGLGKHQDRHPFWKPMDRLCNRLSHYIVGNSQAVVADTLRRDDADPGKMLLIRNGIDFSRLDDAAKVRNSQRAALGLTDGEVGIVAVGNLLFYKGHADLLAAAPAILSRHPEARIFLVGEDRGMKGDLVRLAERGGIVDRVTFLGHRGDVPDVLAAMDLFVLPSHEEGFSNALLEAMASGLAVVATDVGGNPEALDGGALGVLVPAHDPEGLEEAMGRLLDDPSLRQAFGRKAWADVRAKYSVAAMVDGYLALYAR